MKSNSNIPRIIYIMGTGRSGSTILEILLAAADSVAGIGEVSHIFRDGFIDNLECACNETFSNCEFWTRVRESMDLQGKDPAGLDGLQNRIDWHKRFPINFLGATRGREFEEYEKLNKALYRSVYEATGCDFIVDSSKYAGRALALSRIFPGRVKIIFLTRAPEGITKSFQKKGTEQPCKCLPAIIAYYIYTIMCGRLVQLHRDCEVIPINYEQLKSDPITVLEKIENFANIDLSKAKKRLTENGYFETGHIITGNRLRKQGQIRFKVGVSWYNPKNYMEKISVYIMKACRLLAGGNP